MELCMSPSQFSKSKETADPARPKATRHGKRASMVSTMRRGPSSRRTSHPRTYFMNTPVKPSTRVEPTSTPSKRIWRAGWEMLRNWLPGPATRLRLDCGLRPRQQQRNVSAARRGRVVECDGRRASTTARRGWDSNCRRWRWFRRICTTRSRGH